MGQHHMGHMYKGEKTKAEHAVFSSYRGVIGSVGRYDKDIWSVVRISPDSWNLIHEGAMSKDLFKGHVSFPGTSILDGLTRVRGLGQVELVPGTHELEPK